MKWLPVLIVVIVEVVVEVAPQLLQLVMLTDTPRDGGIQQTMQTPKPSDREGNAGSSLSVHTVSVLY